MANKLLPLGALLPFLAVCAFAQTATTDPVGFVKVPCLGLSDTICASPLTRAPVFTGKIASISGETVQIQGTPGWTAGQYVYAEGAQPNHYYLLIRSGASEGLYYTINGNTTNSITLDSLGEDLASLVAGTEVQIIPFHTFGTLFPSGTGVASSTSHSARNTEVLVPSQTTIGINLAPEYKYYYFAGEKPGWRRVGGGLSRVRNDDYILPDSYLVIRNNSAQGNEITFIGSVPVNRQAIYLSSPQAGAQQDNPFALTVPTDLTLAESKLFESGAFTGTSSHSDRGDELYVYDNAATALNKAPLYIYYYYTGSKPGWRRVGGGITNVRNTDVVFTAGKGYIIRRAVRATVQSQLWSFTPPFAQ